MGGYEVWVGNAVLGDMVRKSLIVSFPSELQVTTSPVFPAVTRFCVSHSPSVNEVGDFFFLECVTSCAFPGEIFREYLYESLCRVSKAFCGVTEEPRFVMALREEVRDSFRGIEFFDE